MDVLEKISGLAQRIAEGRGLELVDAELFRAGRRRTVRILVAKPTGVGVDDCANLSRELSAVLDAEGLLGEEPYYLEVSSPGLDRPFKKPADWRRNLGREARVVCREPVGGKYDFQGVIREVHDDAAVIESRGASIRIPYSAITSAKLEIKIP
jgi:ribosome maturation factor RimP